MAASNFNGQRSDGLQPELPSAPVGRGGKDRRASLVIKETAQLLNGLHEDADRSSALMAELEALLAAAHHASEQLQDLSSSGPYEGDVGDVAHQGLQFAAVEPIRVDNSDGEAEAEGEGEAEAGEEAEVVGAVQAGTEETCEEPVSPACAHPSMHTQAPHTPPPPSATAKRRSSVVTFDGAALFGGGLPPAGGGGGVSSGGQLMPGPPPVAARALSFNRARALTVQAGRSFTERSGTSSVLRRNALTDVGGGGGGAAASQQWQPPPPQQPIPQQQLQMPMPQYCGPAMSAMASALAAAGGSGGGGGVARRPSSNDTVDFVGGASGQQARRSSGLSYTAATSGGGAAATGMLSHGQVFMGTSLVRDDVGDGGFDWPSSGMALGQDLGGGGGGGGGGPGGGGVPARMSGGGSGGGRFMKMLKGIFHPHSGDASSPAIPAVPANPACGSPSAAPAPTLESVLTHGALSSMTPVPVRAPSRSQVTRGSLTNASFTADPVRRASSVQRHLSIGNTGPTSPLSAVGGAPTPLAVGRSASIASFQQGGGSSHALVPTAPTSGVVQPQLTLRRQTSGSGAMAMGTSASSGPATPTALLSPAGSACISPSSPSTTLYGMMSPSAADWRLQAGGGLPTSRRSLHLPTTAGGLRG